jgi:hypothetical protein
MRGITLDKAVDAYLKSDRQWTRAQRIAHAKYQLSIADFGGASNAGEFWKAVLHALEG